jgi:AraC-like DNA-binding protein
MTTSIEHRIEATCSMVLRAHIPAGQRTPWIARPQTAFVLTRHGSVVTEFDPKSGLGRLERGAPAVVCFPAHLRRRSRALPPDGMHYTAALVSFEIFPGVDLLSFLDLPMLLPSDVGQGIGGILEELADLGEQSQGSFRRVARRQELYYRLLGEVLDLSPLHEEAVQRLAALPRLRPVLEHLDQHFTEPVRVDELATIAGLSQGQFHRSFKALAGTSPFEYAKRLRLKLAAGLLRNTDQTVAEIGAQVGWPDPFHFSKMFKSAYAQSPTSYRQHRHILA